MDFYGKLGDLLSEALEKGKIDSTQKENSQPQNESENLQIDFSKLIKELNINENENVTHIDSKDKEKAKAFNFSQFDSNQNENKTNSKIENFTFNQFQNNSSQKTKTFDFQQFAKMAQESSKVEPKVQIYKFSQLVIPQNVLYALNIIGIPTYADYENAKKIYREKILYFHPDKWINTPYLEQAKSNTQMLNNAWEIVEWWFVAR